jgi:fructuronate reductase
MRWRAEWEYDLGIMGPEGLRVERIAVHDRVLVAAEDPRAVIDAIADPDVAAITLTVTEKGYCLTPGGALDTAIRALRPMSRRAPRAP